MMIDVYCSLISAALTPSRDSSQVSFQHKGWLAMPMLV
jgi:hypothetical protein